MNRTTVCLMPWLLFVAAACSRADRTPQQDSELAVLDGGFVFVERDRRLFAARDGQIEFLEVVSAEGRAKLRSIDAIPPQPDFISELLPQSVPASSNGRVAWLAGPTNAYPHAVLGDDLEASTLRIWDSGKTVEIEAGPGAVFEDLRPRWHDFDEDGRPEVMVVRTRADAGAALAVFSTDGSLVSETDPIGTSFRWLCPIGAGDLDDDGVSELVWVVRPHLDATLTVARYEDDGIRAVAELPGHSNHLLGSSQIRQSLILENRVVVPGEAFGELVFFEMHADTLQEVERWALGGELLTDLHVVGDDLVYGIEGPQGVSLRARCARNCPAD